MFRHPTGTLLRCGAVLAVLAGTLVGASAPAQSAYTNTRFGYTGNAYGTRIQVGSAVVSGPTANSWLGCTTKAGLSTSNSTLGVLLRNGATTIGSVGITTTNVTTSLSSGTSVTRSQAKTATVNLLNGLIRVDALTASATTRGKPFANQGTSTFLNLRINGKGYTDNPAPNTKVDLGPLGHVILNEQSSSVTPSSAQQTVTALHLVLVNQSSPLTPIHVYIGRAQSQLNGEIVGPVVGYAYGTDLSVLNGVVRSGKTSLINLPCFGTNGSAVTSSIASLTLPHVLSAGAVASEGSATVGSSTSAATVKDTVVGLNLFGRIKADVVKAELNGSRSEGGAEKITDTSAFIGLTIDGTTYAGNPPVNTKVTVPGLGTLWLHRRIELANGVTEVRMVELVLSAATGGLPLGTSLKIAVAGLDVQD